MVVAPSAQTVCLVNHTIVNELEDHAGKKKRKVGFSFGPYHVKKVKTNGKQLDGGSESVAPSTVEFVSSSVTPTSDHGDHKDSGSIRDGNIRIRRAPEHYVGEVENVTAEPIDGAMGASVLGNRVVNANSTQHVCMMSELHLRYEHKITVRERFERKFTHSSVVVQQKDAEIAILKDKLGKAKSEVEPAVGIRKRVSDLEAAAASRLDEVGSLTAQNAELSRTVSGLKLVCDGLKSQVAKLETDCESLHGEIAGEAKLREEFSSIQDTAAKRFDERSAKLDARIA
ncbi:hypothetical protein Tco_0722793 [Tanacetum coccineum]